LDVNLWTFLLVKCLKSPRNVLGQTDEDGENVAVYRSRETQIAGVSQVLNPQKGAMRDRWGDTVIGSLFDTFVGGESYNEENLGVIRNIRNVKQLGVREAVQDMAYNMLQGAC
jgi:hypothetical protein